MQDLLQCLAPSSFSNLSVLERQRARLQLPQSLESMDEAYNLSCDSLISLPILLQNPPPDQYALHQFTPAFPNAKGCSASPFKCAGEKTSKKRKAGKPPTVDCVEEAEKCKRRKAEVSPEKPKEIKDPPPAPKQDFIHVRARRGQATDSHSLAERVRRERISERMKYLQGLVPGCDKITGKAGMLDEIINYVQSLQRQVEFLSMKLATANPWPVELDMDGVFPKEVNFGCNPSVDMVAVGVACHDMPEPYLHMNPMHQMPGCCALNNLSDLDLLALRRSLASPAAAPHPFLPQSFQVENSSWDANSESICGVDHFHHEGKETMLALQSLSGGNGLPSNLKMEM